MLLPRVPMRFDCVRPDRHSVEEMLESRRLVYVGRLERYLGAEARVFTDFQAGRRRLGALTCGDSEASAHRLLLATDSLLPLRPTARNPGKRAAIRQKALRIADVLLAGLRSRRTALNPREKPS